MRCHCEHRCVGGVVLLFLNSHYQAYFDTYCATEYDRTPLAPPSEAERSCVLPSRGSRCLSFLGLDEEEVDHDSSEDEVLRYLPASPFATPEDSDSECDGREEDEWSECIERRRMMFARMCPLESDAHPQFEGYRSLSATLATLLQSVADSDEEEDASATPRASFHEREDDEDDAGSEASEDVAEFSPCRELQFPLFSRLRESSTDSEEVGTPSLISSADSDTECSGLMSPRGSAVDFLPAARTFLPSNNHVPSWKGVSPVRYAAPNEHAHSSIEL